MTTTIQFYLFLSDFICEPVTAITDFMLAFYCIWCYKKIRSIELKSDSTKYWGLFLLFIGCSTLFGGLNHTVTCSENQIYSQTYWICMQITSGISLFFAQKAVFESEVKNIEVYIFLNRLAFFQLITFICCVIFFWSFKVVAINSLIGLIQLIVFCLPKNLGRTFHKHLFTFGFLISFLTIYVNHNKIDYAFWFNHNDISHVIMFVSLWLIHKGIQHKHKDEKKHFNTIHTNL